MSTATSWTRVEPPVDSFVESFIRQSDLTTQEREQLQRAIDLDDRRDRAPLLIGA